MNINIAWTRQADIWERTLALNPIVNADQSLLFVTTPPPPITDAADQYQLRPRSGWEVQGHRIIPPAPWAECTTPPSLPPHTRVTRGGMTARQHIDFTGAQSMRRRSKMVAWTDSKPSERLGHQKPPQIGKSGRLCVLGRLGRETRVGSPTGHLTPHYKE